jgi:hypothetical protein
MGGWMEARDELWEIVEPLLPRVREARTGRPRVPERLHRELLRRLNALGAIDWSAGIIDGTHVRALKGGI